MGAPDILMQLRGMGLTLTAQGASIRAEPKAALNDDARALIRTHKSELLAALRELQRNACGQSHAEMPDKSDTQTATASSASPLLAIETAKGNQYVRASLESINEDCAAFYEERAAIMEYDGGLSREDAEAAAHEATEQHRRECWERFQKRAAVILSLPTWEGRLKAIERHRQAHGGIAGQEMMSWVRHKSGLGVE